MRVSSGRTVGEVVLEDNQNTGSTQIERLQIIDKKSITMSVGKEQRKRSKVQKKKKKNRKRQRKNSSII